MLNFWKLNFIKGESNQHFQYIGRVYFSFSNSLRLSPAKSYYWNVFLRIYNNFSEQNFLNKPVFDNVSRLNHSSPMNNTITKKNQTLSAVIRFRPQTDLKWRWQYILFWSVITTKLDIYVYKCRDDYICKGLFQAIGLVTINIWLNFLLEINPLLA